jgi:hypothetical protein
MELESNEIMIWDQKCHMIINGEVLYGDLIITNNRMVFRSVDDPTFLSRKITTTDIWDLETERVLEVNVHEMVGFDHPLIRVRYKEDEVFFRFPEYGSREAATALVVFINHARLIKRLMSVMKNVEESLKEGNLVVGEKLPHILVDVPNKADEDCFQCGKSLIGNELELINEQVKECLMCEG